MFGKKKKESQDYRYMSNVELACRFPQIANIKNANEDLTRENCKLEDANARLQEELAKYKALYEEAKNGQAAPANSSSTSAYLDTAIWEENKRLTNEIKDLKAKLATCNNSTAPDTDLAALKNELTWATDHVKDLEAALYNERAENASLKEKLNNGGNTMGNEVTQWEYKLLRTHNGESEANIDELNRLGKDGWEVAGIEAPSAPLERYVLKRPKQKEDYGYSR